MKDRSNRSTSLVSLILCEICKKYETKICSSKNFSKVCFKEFSADSAVELWWQECCTSRRPNQPQRKLYKPRMNTSSSSTCTSDTDCVTSSSKTDGQDSTISLDEWDNLFDTS